MAETWRAVEIDATGWRIVSHPPVRFRRSAGMQPVPVPPLEKRTLLGSKWRCYGERITLYHIKVSFSLISHMAQRYFSESYI